MKNRIKGNGQWGTSVRRLPWDDAAERNGLQSLITSTVDEWYEAKHPNASESEIAFFNSIAPASCPACGIADYRKNGTDGKGFRLYKCRSCGFRFRVTTGTVFDSRKIPVSEWIEYLLHLFEFHSVATSSRDNRNSSSTGAYWLKKVFAVLEGSQDGIVLNGKVFLDEMFFSKKPSETHTVNGKRLRGISRNKECVAVATDGNDIIVLAEHTSKPSETSTMSTLESHIGPGSILVHDGERSHGALIRKLGLVDETHPTAETRELADKDNPLEPVNDLHSLVRRFMREHGSFDRDHLQDWMNLARFVIAPPHNRYEKVELFIRTAVSKPVLVRYRESMRKKEP